MTIHQYLEILSTRYRSGISREHSYRGDLENLIRSLVPEINVTNEPTDITDCGNPDYVLTKGKIPVGYIEAKDVGKDLASKVYNEQFTRYREALDNLIITDYLWFRFYSEGELVHEIRFARIEEGKVIPLEENFQKFENLLINFCSFVGQTIRSSKKLAVMMANKARLLQNILENAITYPPLGSSNPPFLLREEIEMFAEKIKAQQTTLIDKNLQINSTEENETGNKNKYIRPDLTFYDSHGAPLLFIEIVITHPVDDKKKAKLINLGIDTIQIDIPHGNKDELKEIIDAGTNTKWVFNNEEFYTDYFSITGENRKEFPSINEQQRNFFQESSTCRRARIRELIQSIERCMETGKFLAIKKELGAEIIRFGELTKAAKSRLGKMEKEQKAGLYSEFEPEESSLREAEKKERAEQERIESEQKDLEARYTAKAEKLREEESAIRRRERDVFGAEDPLGELPRRIDAVSGDINRLQGKSGIYKAEEDEISDEERRIDEQLAEFARIEERVYG